MKSTAKSAGAIIAGLLTVGVLSTATDFALAALGVFPPITDGTFAPWMLGVALAYRMAYTVLGGYVAARLAPRFPMRHAITLGIVGTIAGMAGIAAGWDMPHIWYPILIAVTGFPCTWLGGYLRVNQVQA